MLPFGHCIIWVLARWHLLPLILPRSCNLGLCGSTVWCVRAAGWPTNGGSYQVLVPANSGHEWLVINPPQYCMMCPSCCLRDTWLPQSVRTSWRRRRKAEFDTWTTISKKCLTSNRFHAPSAWLLLTGSAESCHYCRTMMDCCAADPQMNKIYSPDRGVLLVGHRWGFKGAQA
jgi:hypothetical protein